MHVYFINYTIAEQRPVTREQDRSVFPRVKGQAASSKENLGPQTQNQLIAYGTWIC